MNDQELVQSWITTIARDDVRLVLDSIYDYAAEAAAQRGPVCDMSGRCCRFEEFDHRLYVTGLEAAYTVTRLTEEHPALTEDTLLASLTEGRCPFQSANVCDVHQLRPLGCRVFFCDPVAAGWQERLSEKLLEQIRRLHIQHNTPYRYGEWRAMLRLFVENAAVPTP